MRYNKFVFLYTSNFCERINDFYCIDQWVANGYDVEYWDLSSFTCHEHLAEYKVDGLVVKEVVDLKEFKCLVKEYKKFATLYLTWVTYCWYSAGFYEILSKNKCDYAFFDNGLIPPLNVSKEKKYSVRRFINSIKGHYYITRSKTPLLRPASYYFRLTPEYFGADKIDRNTVLGWCNSGDYESNFKINSYSEGKYIVFLDQYIPYHNDNILNGFKQIEPEGYYRVINSFFRIIEKETGYPVIIAAHPAAKKYNDFNPFEGRKVIFNQTAELVKGCELVLAHFTTAISFVVLNNKKMLLMETKTISEVRPDFGDYILQLAELLGLKCINIDEVRDNNTLLEYVTMKGYNEYKYRYLTNKNAENHNNYENIMFVLNK